MDLKMFFGNPFKIETITPPRLKNFAEDHVARLQANNAGNVYDSIIASTQAAITALGSLHGSKTNELGERAGSVTSKTQAREALQTFISDKEGLVKSTFGKKSAEYKEIFPQGLSAFHKADDEVFEELAGVLLTKATKYVGELGAAFKTDLTTLLNIFSNAEDAVEVEKGDVDGENAQMLLAFHALQIQLTKNVHTIALQNSDGPPETIATTFFDQSLLFAEHTRHIFAGGVAPHSTEPVAALEYHASNHLLLEHKSAGDLKWRMRLNGVPVGNEFVTHIGEKLDKAFSDFAADADELVVINDEDVAGEYRVVEIS